jgi:hypothetical protein
MLERSYVTMDISDYYQLARYGKLNKGFLNAASRYSTGFPFVQQNSYGTI